jgi:hypothetical protein
VSLSTLVVSGTALKLALGITDTSEDAELEQFEAAAVAWVEGEVHRRFQSPADDQRVEYHEGTWTRTLYLKGHIDDPDSSITVRERSSRGGQWTTLTEGTDYERRGDTLISLDRMGWSCWSEYEVTYDDGYEDAPADIQALIIELVASSRTMTDGGGDVTSETIGEYSYTVASAVAIATLDLTGTGRATINRWKRGRV